MVVIGGRLCELDGSLLNAEPGIPTRATLPSLVPVDREVVRLVLADGRLSLVSPDLLSRKERPVVALRAGDDALDGSVVAWADRITRTESAGLAPTSAS